MLKIKDNVDLEELKKFGYECLVYCWCKDVGESLVKFQWAIRIDKETKEIICFNFSEGKTKEPTPYIQDLIQAGLVEKVGDSCQRD